MGSPLMNPSLSTESSSNSSWIAQNTPFNVKEDIIKQILEEKCFYKKLGLRKTAQPCDIRRAYLQKSKKCHPDRNDHPNSKEAFQSLSTAYKTLITNQKAYDMYGFHVDGNEQTLNEVISQIFKEFVSGHYDSLIRIIEQMQSLNPDISINSDRARYILMSMKPLNASNVLATVREFCMYTSQYWSTAKFDIIGVYEIHQQLAALSYFDFLGRAKLSCALSKGMLTIPLTVMKTGHGDAAENELMCSLLIKLICFLDGCESKLERSSRLLSVWR